MKPSTFSIVAFDPATGDLGVAVESKFLSVGAVVPWAVAGVGAIATQALANTSYGPRGLRMLKQGMTPKQAGRALIAADKQSDRRQFGMIDVKGRTFTYTGGGCHEWAGGKTGKNYAAQGNILASPEVVNALAETFEMTRGSLAERLVKALAAGQAAGGDRRGEESAALLVVRPKGGYGGFTDRYIDLRVDDHPHPIDELQRLLDLHHLYLGKTRPEDILPIDPAMARELQEMMQRLGYYGGAINGEWDGATETAFNSFAGVENVEERLLPGASIDKVVLDFLRKRFGQ